MKALARRARGAAAWLLAGLAVAVHAALAVLAVTEFAALGWPLPTGYDNANVTLVLATAVTGLAASSMVAARATSSSRALRALLGAAHRPVPPIVHNAATGLGVAGKVDAVAAGDEDPDGVRIVLVEVPTDHPLRGDPRSSPQPT